MSALASPEPHVPRPGRSRSAPFLGQLLGTHAVADRTRRLLALRAAHGSTLVVDEDASGTDRLVLAHITADEPNVNVAELVRDFLARPPDRVARLPTPTDPYKRLRDFATACEPRAAHVA